MTLAPTPPFAVGDLVEQYRYFSDDGFIDGQKPDKVGTRWRVLELTADAVVMELVEGRYEWFDDEPWKYPGHVVRWETSELYRKRFPGAQANQQTFDEYRRVER